MNIVLKSVDDLINYENNARLHSSDQINQIVDSIKNFGFNDPIEIGEDNILISGHARLEAAKKLGMKEVPTITHAHMTKTQRKGYVLAANRIAMSSTWDSDLLKLEFEDLQGDDFNLLLTGFEQDEIDLLLNPEELNDGLVDADECGEIDEENVVSKLGDVWLCGRHRVMCGDSTMIDEVSLLMNGAKADMVFTDPPYGVEYQSNMRTKSKKFDVLINDNLFLDIAPIIDSVSEGWVFIWTSWKVQNKWIDQFKSFSYPTNMVVWHKPGGGIGDLKKTFSSDYEVDLVWHRGADLCGKRIGSVWTISKDSASTYNHPTQKPVSLAEEALDKCTKCNDGVLDLFGGSGSTLIACEKLGRNCYMMELDPKYCDVIIRRFEKFTGKKAIHADTGEEFNEL